MKPKPTHYKNETFTQNIVAGVQVYASYKMEAYKKVGRARIFMRRKDFKLRFCENWDWFNKIYYPVLGSLLKEFGYCKVTQTIWKGRKKGTYVRYHAQINGNIPISEDDWNKIWKEEI